MNGQLLNDACHRRGEFGLAFALLSLGLVLGCVLFGAAPEDGAGFCSACVVADHQGFAIGLLPTYNCPIPNPRIHHHA